MVSFLVPESGAPSGAMCIPKWSDGYPKANLSPLLFRCFTYQLKDAFTVKYFSLKSCAIIRFYYSLRKVANVCLVSSFIPVTAGMLLNRFSNEI